MKKDDACKVIFGDFEGNVRGMFSSKNIINNKKL